MKKRSASASVTLVLLVLTGCGASSGPSASSFKSGFATQKVQFSRLGKDLQTALIQAPGKTDVTLAVQFRTLAARTRQQAAALSKLAAPAKYKSRLAELVFSFDAVSGDLTKIAAAAAKHDGSAARASTTAMVGDAAKVKASDNSLTRALGLRITG